MRIGTKFGALERIIINGKFNIKAETILSGAQVVIHNWQDVRATIQILREIDWLPDDQRSKLLDDYLEHRGEGDTLEIDHGAYRTLIESINRYEPGLPVLMKALQAHAVSADPSVIWVEILSASDPRELASAVEEVSRALTIAQQAGHAFRFVGVAQGSNWFGFDPSSSLVGIVINCCIHLASTILKEISTSPRSVMASMAKMSLENAGADSPTQDDINEYIEQIHDRVIQTLAEAGSSRLGEYLESGDYSESDRNMAKTAVMHATKAIVEMQRSGTAKFEPSHEGQSITINVYGNENVEINLPGGRAPEALPPGDTD